MTSLNRLIALGKNRRERAAQFSRGWAVLIMLAIAVTGLTYSVFGSRLPLEFAREPHSAMQLGVMKAGGQAVMPVKYVQIVPPEPLGKITKIVSTRIHETVFNISVSANHTPIGIGSSGLQQVVFDVSEINKIWRRITFKDALKICVGGDSDDGISSVVNLEPSGFHLHGYRIFDILQCQISGLRFNESVILKVGDSRISGQSYKANELYPKQRLDALFADVFLQLPTLFKKLFHFVVLLFFAIILTIVGLTIIHGLIPQRSPERGAIDLGIYALTSLAGAFILIFQAIRSMVQ